MPREQKLTSRSFVIMEDGTVLPVRTMSTEDKAVIAEKMSKRISAAMSDHYMAQANNHG